MQHVTIISRDFLTILVLHQSFKYLNGEAWVFLMISCHDAGAHFGARHAGDGHEGLQGRRGAPQDGKTPSRLGPISPEKVARWKGNPLISRKSRLVKYDNLARCWCKRSLYLYDNIFCLMSFVHIHRQSTFLSTFMFIESQNMKCI